jgi:putative DNA primase/helicase
MSVQSEPRVNVASSNSAAQIDNSPKVDSLEGQTDLANARRFVALNRDRVLFCHAWKKWLVWDSQRWRVDTEGAVGRLAQSVADHIWELAKLADSGNARMFAARSSSSSSIKAMLALATDMLPVAPDDLDQHPWLLNVPNGTIDLRTVELRDHRREDRITILCPTEYDPEAGSYNWDRFLEAIFVTQDLIDFVQRLFGYCLTGDVSEQILPIFWGIGANGKSTLLNAFMNALGTDYAMQAIPDLLMVKKNNSHPTERADLFGKRFVSCVETGGGQRLAVELVKQLTGGERIRARRMREDFWEFPPTHKIILCTNNKPRIPTTDHATWRRLGLVPFNVCFWNPDAGETGPEELEQNKQMPEILEEESEGILAWAVRGCLEWQSGGLRMPDPVKEATAEYRDQENVLKSFIADCCVVGPNVKTRSNQLYGQYTEWSKQNGEYTLSHRRFGEAMTQMDFKRKSSNGTWYLGITIRADA